MTTNGKSTTKTPAALSEVQMAALNQAVKILNALPLQYRVITDTGLEFGALQGTTTKSGKKRERCLHYPYGTISAGVKERCSGLEVGGVVQLPVDLFPLMPIDSFYSTIAGWCNNTWGPGSYKMCKTATHIEVLRIS